MVVSVCVCLGGAVTLASPPFVVVVCAAALDHKLTTDSTDSEAAWMAELGGESSSLWQVIQGLIQQYKNQGGSGCLLRQPIPVPIGLGPQVRGSRSLVSVHSKAASHTRILPRAQLVVVPGVEGADHVRALLQSLLNLNFAGSQAGCSSYSPAQIDLGSNRIVTPPSTERGHLVPPSIVPAGEVASRLSLLVAMLHCDSDARTRVEAEDGTIASGCKWYPDEQCPAFVEVLETLVRDVYDCMVVVLACGGWTAHPHCLVEMKRLAREHRLIFVLPQRVALNYLDVNDPTLISFLRFVTAVMPDALQLQLLQPQLGSRAGRRQGAVPTPSQSSRLLGIALKYARSVLAADSVNTRPIIIDHEERVTEIYTPSERMQAMEVTMMPVAVAKFTPSTDDVMMAIDEDEAVTVAAAVFLSSNTPTTSITAAVQPLFRVTSALVKPSHLPHATATGTLGQINKFMQVRSTPHVASLTLNNHRQCTLN
jgi:hypothetical protein